MKNNSLSIVIVSIFMMASPGAGTTAQACDDGSPCRTAPEENTGPMAYALKIFSKTVSRVDGHRCAMYPTCSAYSAQAFEKHGFVKGWILTSDRLLRCGRDEKRLSETIFIHRQPHVYDPLKRNDFWWSEP